jgi:hypothetical protein
MRNALLFLALLAPTAAFANGNVYVSRFWHDHQPIYWPEWNGAPQPERVQYANDSINLKSGQTYGTGVGHPDNNLTDIFGLDDRRSSYQSRPRDSLAGINSAGGFAMSYSGSLIDNVRNLGAAGALGYGSGWWDGNREASEWYTPSGSRRLDLVGFTYHHSLAPVLPKAVFRKELQIFKQAWWKAWDQNANLSDHSKGYFPTEMAFSESMIDVLVDEGYQWSIIASHHLSRTCPTYFNYANPTGSFNIYSSPPNRADLLGPSPTTGWWYGEPNPGNAAWNVSPYAYQLHKAQYVNPSNGATKSLYLVPSDDVLSYRFGYANEGIGKIQTYISPFATDASRPVLVMPSTDGDNAWGGGFSSWMEATPQFYNDSAGAGYHRSVPQDFVNVASNNADLIHIEDGAWIFPETDYGSPYFLKWIEPPLSPTNLAACYPGTKVNLEGPGFALKFWSWAPVIAGANWCETAEQMVTDTGGSVQAYKIQGIYDFNGTYLSPNYAERAWHIYLCGLDSGFNYYGGLGNDDEVKQSLATRRAVEMLQAHVLTNLVNDRTAPTVFKPQRFPWNPGGHTFGWFNSLPGGGTNGAYLKKMASEFYIWTHAFDISGITSIVVKARFDNDGVNTMANSQNETYAGGADVGSWQSIAMTKRELPNTQSALNAAASNGQIDYFITPPTNGIADYYFAKFTDASAAGFRGKLLDYYIEAYDGRGNLSRSDIQHVFVENDGQGGSIPSTASFSSDPNDCAPLTITYVANGGVLSNSTPVSMWLRFATNGAFTAYTMTNVGGTTSRYTIATVPDDAPVASIYFQNDIQTLTDNNFGFNWSTSIRDCNAPTGTSAVIFSNAAACSPVTVTFFPNAGVLQTATQVFMHLGFNGWAQVFPTQLMAKITNNMWRITVEPPYDVSQIDLVFHNGAGTWDNNGGLDWHYALNVCSSPVVPPGITITNPATDISVGNDIATYTVEGQVGAGVVGIMKWTNGLTGGSGQLSTNNPWSIGSISLGVGANTITVSGTNVGSGSITSAYDIGSDAAYTDGWTAADSGGSGFGAWALYTSSTNGSENGRFMANAGTVSVGTPAWGLYANNGNLSEAKRLLASQMAVGETLAVRMDNGFINGGSGVGVALQNLNGDTLWEFFFNGGDSYYNITGGTNDIGWTTNGIDVEITLAGPTSYFSRITPIGGTTRTNTGNFNAQADSAVKVFRAWNFNAGSGSDYDFFFNRLQLMTAAGGSGATTSDTVTITRQSGTTDTDGDGMPDAWEQTHFGGVTNGSAGADGDGDGVNNLDEFIADTVPTDGASASSNIVMDVSGVNVMQLTVEAPTTNSRIYDVWYRTNLLQGAGWLPMGLNITGAQNGASINLTVTNVPGERHYRTGVRLPQ